MNKVKIKICGLCRLEDIDAVNYAMPDYIGFVFAKSKRQIGKKMAATLKKKLDQHIPAIGVFSNQPIAFITDLYQNGIIDGIQLHGAEEDEYIRRLRRSCQCKIIKSVSIDNKLPVLPKAADYLLFDTASEQGGGTGKPFNWNILANYQGPPYFLAGGLTSENISDALRHLLPFSVDVSSGVETSGVKDLNKINNFVQMVRRL